MNRIDRLFAILLLIQRKRCLRAVDLAQAFEVSERTIYRDMTALSESGVPIVALPGTGYQLTEGYYLPPLLFSPDEAAALFLSIQMLLAHTTGGIHANATSALAKIAVILPTPLRQTTEHLAATIQFFKPAARFTGDDPQVEIMTHLIQQLPRALVASAQLTLVLKDDAVLQLRSRPPTRPPSAPCALRIPALRRCPAHPRPGRNWLSDRFGLYDGAGTSRGRAAARLCGRGRAVVDRELAAAGAARLLQSPAWGDQRVERCALKLLDGSGDLADC
jgi:biotin operon repressor